MKNENFQKRVRDFAAANEEYNIDLFNLMKEKHELLIKEDAQYLKSTEYYFLSEILNPAGDVQLRTYFRDQLINSEPESWKKSYWTRFLSYFRK